MQSAEGHSPLSLRASDDHLRIEHQERIREVARLGSNAMLARAQARQQPVAALDGRATGTRLALVARHHRVPKLAASGALQQVSAKSCEITHLWRSTG